jgi:hypothetical protein
MKAEIKEGCLFIVAENHIESYALKCWHEKNINGCTGQFISDKPYYIFGIETQIPKINVFHRIWFNFKLFLYK